MQETEKTARSPFRGAVIIGILVFIISATGVVSIYSHSVDAINDQIRLYIENIASTAAAFTDGDIHKKILIPEDINGKPYLTIEEEFEKLMRSQPDIKYTYTFIYRDDKIYFVVDVACPQDNAEPAKIMEVYDNATPRMFKAAMTGSSAVERDFSTDKWGTFLSGYAPFFDSEHKLVGMVGVDVNINSYMMKFKTLKDSLIISIILCFISALLVGYYILTSQVNGNERLTDHL